MPTIRTTTVLLTAILACLVPAAIVPAQPANDSTWAFEPGEDPFTGDAILDLRYLNEAESGEQGFIRLSEDGESFVLGNGEPIRFWSTVLRVDINTTGFSPDDIENLYRFLAKRGVNLVRVFSILPPSRGAESINDVDEAQIDRVYRHIAAAKKNGVYIMVTTYWPHNGVTESWDLEGVEAGKSPWGLIYFNPKMQEAYKAWNRALYAKPNPYTGLKIGEDPTVAIVQIINEDSLFFWTFNAIPDAQKRLLGKQFGDWLAKEHGSLETAAARWDGASVEQDDFANGVVFPYGIYELTQPDNDSGKSVRVKDQTEFMARLQRGWYEDMATFFKDELGCQQLINASNWRPGDMVRLGDLERWTYAGNDVISLNGFVTGRHNGPNRGWRIDPGDTFTNRSGLKDISGMPFAAKQIAGHPLTVNETTWVLPNLYQSEESMYAAAYMSLTGVDTLHWFCVTAPGYDNRISRGPGLTKWSASTPQQFGQFPAAALAFRLGYIEEAAEPAVFEHRAVDAMFERAVPIIAEGGRYDPNRDAGDFAQESAIKQEVDRLAYFVGPVKVAFDSDPAKTTAVDLSEYIDHEAGTVKSMTGQLELDHKVGLLTIDTPRAQSVVGFLADAGGWFNLTDVSITTGNDYASIAVVAMDEKPLTESGKVLVQVGTSGRLTGWETKVVTIPAGQGPDAQMIEAEEIINTGQNPWRLVNTDATVVIRNPNLSKATLLDANGYAVEDVPVKRTEAGLAVELPANAMYVVLE